MTPDLVLTTLPGGMRVCVDPMPSLETAAIGVWANVGSVDERAGEHGAAHLLEHMAFKGTKTRSARAIAEDIEAVGGHMNAATSNFRTGYYVRVLKEDIDLGLDILSDILVNPAFDAGELAREKDVVVQEIGEVADTPDDVVFENLQALAWDGHPLARPILGTPASVRAQTPEAMRAFMARGYRPDNMVVAAAGAVEPEAFANAVSSAFAGLTPTSETDARAPAAFVGGVRLDARALEQTHIAVAFAGVSTRDDDFFASRIFAEILGGGMASRLFQKVREARGLAYSVYAFSDNYDDCGLVGCYAGAAQKDAPEIAAAFREEIAAMAGAVDDVEIARARSMLRASLLMALESPSARIESAAGQIFRNGSVMTADAITARLDAVGADDVKRCAARAAAGPFALSIVGAADIDATARALSV